MSHLLQHWTSQPYWEPIEAVALSLGFDPFEIKNRRRSSGPHDSPYDRRMDFVRRLIDSQKLDAFAARYGDKGKWEYRINAYVYPPYVFVECMEHYGMEFPEKIRDAVASSPDRQLQHLKSMGELQKELEAAKKELGAVKQKAEESTVACSEEEAINGKRKTSYQKAILGVAMDVYKYNRYADRNKAISEILSCIDRSGIPSLDPKTLRDILEEATDDCLPDKEKEKLRRQVVASAN
ncbi:MAG: hypothetical protein ABW189_00670 [Rickettsiales bacterium]